MSHETLQALYALDVAEVGEKEAAKRWEFWRGDAWVECFQTIKWNSVVLYRRKPDLPWPKVMMQDAKEWPADAPEWANYIAIDGDGQHKIYANKPLHSEMHNSWIAGGGKYSAYDSTCPNWRDSLIERPKPAVKKIDWSNLPPAVASRMSPAIHKDGPLSGWIAWNCDQDTRGNLLPDGLVVEWYEETHSICLTNTGRTPNWKQVTRFRIVGIQEGWE